ncbi:MAG: alpha/beta hydrolase [Pseudomonadota bacterium]
MTHFPDPEFVMANGVRLATYKGGSPNERPAVILVHGWPEIAYSWKHQIDPLVQAGFHVIAYDQKGFGASDCPEGVDQYDIAHMTDDLAGLLDALEIDRAILCGHDWGGAVVWPMAQLHPERVAGVIGVCTPHRPPPPVPPLQIMEDRFTANHYIVQFQQADIPEQTFAGREEAFFRFIFRYSPGREHWPAIIPGVFDFLNGFAAFDAANTDNFILNPEDLQVFVDAYKKSGFRGGINLYRNIDQNYEIMKSRDPVIPYPSLWIGADRDLFLPMEGADRMEKLVPDLEKQVIENCGHWVMWEKPEALNALLIDWLNRRF